MTAFRDIFVIQLIGILLERKFTGTLAVNVEKGSGKIQCRDGTVCHIYYGGLPVERALQSMLWYSRGELELGQESSTDDAPEYRQRVESLIQTSIPQMPLACPMMEHAFVAGAPLKTVQQSAFRDTGFAILLNIKKGAPLAEAQKNIPLQDFWPGFFHLCSNGQVLCDYSQTLGKLVHDFENATVAKLKKLMGSQVANTYQEKVRGHVQAAWPDYQPGQDFDILYGTAPYYDWAQALKITLKEIGAPTITERCYQKTLHDLNPDEAAVFQELLL